MFLKHRTPVTIANTALGHKNWRYTGIWIKLMRGGKKDKGGKKSLQPQKMSNQESMVWTRGRIAYDLIGHK
jgi:hypothetical protein